MLEYIAIGLSIVLAILLGGLTGLALGSLLAESIIFLLTKKES